MKRRSLIHRLVRNAAVLFRRKEGFGMNELLGIAAALILAAFIIIPQLQGFAEDVMQDLHDWWDTRITSEIFQTESSGS